MGTGPVLPMFRAANARQAKDMPAHTHQKLTESSYRGGLPLRTSCTSMAPVQTDQDRRRGPISFVGVGEVALNQGLREVQLHGHPPVGVQADRITTLMWWLDRR